MGNQWGYTLEGLDKAIRVLEAAADNAPRILGQALLEEAMLVGRTSQKEVPVRDGFLKASFTIEPPIVTPLLVRVTMGYGGAASEYAEYVHNSPYEKNWTTPGTKSHFLSDPLQQAMPHLTANIIRRVSRMAER